MSKYKQRKDCEGFEVPSGQVHKIACCDCGLVHDFVFVSEDGKPIGIAARRNNRATGQLRRKRTRATTPGKAVIKDRGVIMRMGANITDDPPPILTEDQRRQISQAAEECYDHLRWITGDSEQLARALVRLARDSFAEGLRQGKEHQ